MVRPAVPFSAEIHATIVVTITDAPNLSATHLIHVNSPTWNAGAQAEGIDELDKATMNILALAEEKELTSVAIPSISSGKCVLLSLSLCSESLISSSIS